MYKFKLTNTDSYAIIDDEQPRILTQHTSRWHITDTGYVRGYSKVTGKHIFLHRALLDAAEGEIIDHINGNKLDNRKVNLRKVTHIQNCQNQIKRKNLTSKYKGVSKTKTKRYQAELMVDGSKVYLGTYKTEIEAANAYNEKAKELFGEYANLNKVKRVVPKKTGGPNPTTKTLGVYPHGSRFVAYIHIKRKKVHIGVYSTVAEADKARKEYLLSL